MSNKNLLLPSYYVQSSINYIITIWRTPFSWLLTTFMDSP